MRKTLLLATQRNHQRLDSDNHCAIGASGIRLSELLPKQYLVIIKPMKEIVI